ncbi:hypothetical protein F5884DRAFT_748955 [Xylogone sp. PMI_703]|nr:hypothetical protein F5884DRAFT_748955 [Xylogone sp. PMI_703]
MQRPPQSQTSPPGPAASIPLASLPPSPQPTTSSSPVPVAQPSTDTPNTTVPSSQTPSNPLAAGPPATPAPASQATPTPTNSASNVTPPSGNPTPQNQVTQNVVLRRKSLASYAWDVKEFIYALVMVGLLDGLAWTASSINSPLGSISYQSGVLILNIFAIFTGHALSAAAGLVWDRVIYRILLRNKGKGCNLVVFWALTGEFWVPWLLFWKELWRELRQKLYRILQPRHQNTNLQAQAGTRTSRRAHVKSWSLAKMLSWMLMQFPGIVVMTVVNTATSFIPVQWIPIGGGIGVYDPKAAFPDIAPILISDSVTNILQDTRRAVQVDPINEECIRSGDSCQSFLIPGGLFTVSPSPYNKTNDTGLDVFVTKGGPAYQIDLWSPPETFTWTADECNIYAAGISSGFQLCASPYPGGPSQIVTGWTPCLGEILPNRQCDQPGSWKAYRYMSTVLSISRRTATVYSSRKTSTILSLEDLGEPTLQNITVEDFKTAFDVMLLPWTNASSLSYSTSSSVFSLTSLVYTQIIFGLTAPVSIQSIQYLQNLFATPLYIFNPLVVGVSAGLPAITNIQPDLAPENYIEGSFARTRTHVVPERWTVIVFVVVSGAILFVDFTALVVTAFFKGPDASDFDFVDSLKLKWFDLNDNGKEVASIEEVLKDVDIDDNDELLRRAAEINVKVGANATTGIIV